MLRVAREYTRKSNTPWERVRFDVVAVVMRKRPEVRLLKGEWAA